MAGYEVDADILRARTLPGRFYRDPEVWRSQRELLARAWHLYAEGALPAPGDLRPFTLLPDALDEPLLLSRGERMRCLANVCPHRGAIVLTEPAQARGSIRCPYHGRRFDLSGRCLSAPGFEQVEGFPGDGDHLVPAAFGELGPLGFVSVDPGVAFDEQIEPLRDLTSWLPWDDLQLDPSASRRYRFAANWALYVDNYLEGFHIPFVHPSLAKAVALSSYTVELHDHGGSLQWAEAATGEPALEPPADHPLAGRRLAGLYVFLFPCTMVNVYPWGVSVNAVIPRGLADTEVRFFSWIWDESLRAVGAGADLDRVEMEDEAVIERVQRGIRSRLYDRGRYAPTEERAVHHFHRALAAWPAVLDHVGAEVSPREEAP